MKIPKILAGYPEILGIRLTKSAQGNHHFNALAIFGLLPSLKQLVVILCDTPGLSQGGEVH